MSTQGSPLEEMVISGLGLVCPVGLDVAQACASMRAGLDRFQETEDYFCTAADADLAEPEPLVSARVPGIAEQPGPKRLTALAVQALADLVEDAQLRRADLATLGLFLVLPDRPEQAVDASEIFSELEQETGISLRAGNQVFASGRRGWFEAIHAAAATLAENPHWRFVLLAVDSLLDKATLQALDQVGRLKSERNLDGFIPGEAAAAILVEHREAAQSRGAKPRATIAGMGIANEPHPYGSPGVCTGTGFVQAVTQSLQPLPTEETLTWLLSDYNGESHRGREWGNSQVQLLARLPLEQTWYPAESTGEIGAATPAVACVLAAQTWQQGLAPAHRALIIAAEDQAQRAALVLADVT